MAINQKIINYSLYLQSIRTMALLLNKSFLCLKIFVTLVKTVSILYVFMVMQIKLIFVNCGIVFLQIINSVLV